MEQAYTDATEQEIAVPKISCPARPLRAVLAATQTAEHLVEVQTVVPQSFFQQRFAEQNVDNPVLGARGLLDGGGLQGFPSGRSSKHFVGQTLVMALLERLLLVGMRLLVRLRLLLVRLPLV